jgi:hypothetical protein
LQTEEKQSARRAAEIQKLQERNGLLLSIDAEKNQAEVDQNQLKIDSILMQERAGSTVRLKIEADRIKKQQALDEQRLNTVKGFFGDLSSLSKTGNKDLFEAGKVFAVAQSVINTSQAVTKALTLGPLLGPIAAAGIAVKGGVEIATISAQRLARGIDEVPAGFPDDSFPARLTSGERVVDANTNQQLKSFLDGSENLLPVLQSIDAKLGAGRQVIVQIGSETITNVINDEIESGRALAV